MPSFRFRLKPLLEQKIRSQESAEGALTERRKELGTEEKALENLERNEESLVERYASKRQQTLANELRSGEQIERRSAFLRGLALDIESARAGVVSQKVIVGRAEYAVSEATELVAKCRREVDILTKYRDKLEAKFNRELARLQELESDEIGNMLYLVRGRKS